MKTAISIPNEVYQRAERLARRTKKSRGRLYGDALREYLARHAPDEVTEAMNRACSEAGIGDFQGKDPFVAARRAASWSSRASTRCLAGNHPSNPAARLGRRVHPATWRW